MVHLVEEWAAIEEYAGDKQGFYQVLVNDAVTELRVETGRLGFKREFSNSADPLLKRILAFCKSHWYVKISENIRDEAFFR